MILNRWYVVVESKTVPYGTLPRGVDQRYSETREAHPRGTAWRGSGGNACGPGERILWGVPQDMSTPNTDCHPARSHSIRTLALSFRGEIPHGDAT